MFRKKDFVVIGVALVLALALYGVMTLTRGGETLSGTVQVFAGGELYAEASLGAGHQEEIRVEQENGDVNVVAIDGERVYMAYSSCKNQNCVHQGEVTATNWTTRALGRSIVCLPNEVLVELAVAEGHPSLEIEDVPDV